MYLDTFVIMKRKFDDVLVEAKKGKPIKGNKYPDCGAELDGEEYTPLVKKGKAPYAVYSCPNCDFFREY